MKVGMYSLGCSKNQVDSEMILGLLVKSGFSVTDSFEESDLIIINTCAFIDSAKNEAIETIVDASNNKLPKQRLIVCGCFAERYKDFIVENFKSVDKVITLKDYPRFSEIINHLFTVPTYTLSFNDRVLISSKYSPYIRIADGCNNHCAFCAIPGIRGKYISRSMEDIISETRYLVENGAKELNIIAQDTSKYGIDNYHSLMLPKLLEELSSFKEVEFIRIFYIYPETLTDELIGVIKKHQNIVPYFDIPLQHASDKILKSMGRHFSKQESIDLINKIRKEIPDSVIRTTLMVGFPGETKKDFDDLIDFVVDMKFFHMGAFMYSREEDTKAYTYKNRVCAIVKKKRYDGLMKIQKEISKNNLANLVGKTLKGIVDSYNKEENYYRARSFHFAPDDVDGTIISYSTIPDDIYIGDVIELKIVDNSEYDLYAKIVRILK